MHTRQGVAEPTQVNDIPSANGWGMFEWYENRVEEGLQKLYRVDREQRQHLVEIIHELSDSNMFWKLMAKYEAASDGKSDKIQQEALMGLLARIYIAGTLRGEPGVDL